MTEVQEVEPWQQLGKIPKWEPADPGDFENKIVDDRIARYGSPFNEAILQWQIDSARIRRFFVNGIIPDFSRIPNNPQEVVKCLFAFYTVMNRIGGITIDTLAEDTLMYRGVHTELKETPRPGYSMINTLTNWSLSPVVALSFVGPNCCMLQTLFPKGTQCYFTGHGSLHEFEYIIPGGMFTSIAPPRPVANPFDPANPMKLWQMAFIAKVRDPFYTRGQVWDQTFPFPSMSPLKDTYDTYTREYKTKIADPIARAREEIRIYEQQQEQILARAEEQIRAYKAQQQQQQQAAAAASLPQQIAQTIQATIAQVARTAGQQKKRSNYSGHSPQVVKTAGQQKKRSTRKLRRRK